MFLRKEGVVSLSRLVPYFKFERFTRPLPMAQASPLLGCSTTSGAYFSADTGASDVFLSFTVKLENKLFIGAVY